jgi:phospholipid/cholesterol/gamma-HCH transport system substrate-binding protein
MSGNVIETVMGAVVLVVAALFLYFAYNTSQVRAVEGYQVTARFDRVDGINPGGDVRIAGVKVGSIISESLDPKTYLATVHMTIDPAYKLPADTVAEVVSSGLLGDKYMELVPGGSEKTIPPGGRIKYTQSPVSLENLLGQLMFSVAGGKKPAAGAAAPAPGSGPGGVHAPGPAAAPK